MTNEIVNDLRMAHVAMHRLPRVSPDEPLRYKKWIIPRGVR